MGYVFRNKVVILQRLSLEGRCFDLLTAKVKCDSHVH